MSIELVAKVKEPVSLAELFADIEALLPLAARAPLRVVGEDPSSVVLGPFPVAEYELNGRRYKEWYSTWDRKDVDIEMGTVASVRLGVEHRPSIVDLETGPSSPSEVDLEYDAQCSGFSVHLDAGYLRTKATLFLTVLLATVIARRSGARIHDNGGLLGDREWVEISPLLTMFEKYASSQSFEAFADAFCNDMGLAPNWPDSATLVGKDLSTL